MATSSTAEKTEPRDANSLLHRMHKLVVQKDQQYEITLAFCNARTGLLNAIGPNTAPSSWSDSWAMSNDRTTSTQRHIANLLDDYQAKLQQVQQHWIDLKSLNDEIAPQAADPPHLGRRRRRHIFLLYQAHVERTGRILQTLQSAGGEDRWGPMDIPLPPTSNTVDDESDMVLVALSTLRASVATVEESLTPLLGENSKDG
jgi:hypothetical protein